MELGVRPKVLPLLLPLFLFLLLADLGVHSWTSPSTGLSVGRCEPAWFVVTFWGSLSLNHGRLW